jgi:hypothetical protein
LRYQTSPAYVERVRLADAERRKNKIRPRENPNKSENVAPCCVVNGCGRPIKYKKRSLCRRHGDWHTAGAPDWDRPIRRGRPADPDFKKCPKCGVTKPRGEFYWRTDRKRGCSSRCIPCLRTAHYKKYGLTDDEYQSMVSRQSGCCAICGNPEEGRQLAIDHDHRTGEVRELLCFRCNNGLGCFQDNPGLLSAAIDYLTKHKEMK